MRAGAWGWQMANNKGLEFGFGLEDKAQRLLGIQLQYVFLGRCLIAAHNAQRRLLKLQDQRITHLWRPTLMTMAVPNKRSSNRRITTESKMRRTNTKNRSSPTRFAIFDEGKIWV
jgi:hypothetical protein